MDHTLVQQSNLYEEFCHNKFDLNKSETYELWKDITNNYQQISSLVLSSSRVRELNIRFLHKI